MKLSLSDTGVDVTGWAEFEREPFLDVPRGVVQAVADVVVGELHSDLGLWVHVGGTTGQGAPPPEVEFVLLDPDSEQDGIFYRGRLDDIHLIGPSTFLVGEKLSPALVAVNLGQIDRALKWSRHVTTFLEAERDWLENVLVTATEQGAVDALTAGKS